MRGGDTESVTTDFGFAMCIVLYIVEYLLHSLFFDTSSWSVIAHRLFFHDRIDAMSKMTMHFLNCSRLTSRISVIPLLSLLRSSDHAIRVLMEWTSFQALRARRCDSHSSPD